MISLTDLLHIALRYDAGEPIPDDEMAMLFQAASSPGGVRPKALIADVAGDQWIVKFPSRRDRMNMVAIEAATMALAKQAGLYLPETKMMPCVLTLIGMHNARLLSCCCNLRAENDIENYMYGFFKY
jgi:serine/threonine-protein kinase HipA